MPYCIHEIIPPACIHTLGYDLRATLQDRDKHSAHTCTAPRDHTSSMHSHTRLRSTCYSTGSGQALGTHRHTQVAAALSLAHTQLSAPIAQRNRKRGASH